MKPSTTAIPFWCSNPLPHRIATSVISNRATRMSATRRADEMRESHEAFSSRRRAEPRIPCRDPGGATAVRADRGALALIVRLLRPCDGRAGDSMEPAAPARTAADYPTASANDVPLRQCARPGHEHAAAPGAGMAWAPAISAPITTEP